MDGTKFPLFLAMSTVARNNPVTKVPGPGPFCPTVEVLARVAVWLWTLGGVLAAWGMAQGLCGTDLPLSE